jgi:hypothetical protein
VEIFFFTDGAPSSIAATRCFLRQADVFCVRSLLEARLPAAAPLSAAFTYSPPASVHQLRLHVSIEPRTFCIGPRDDRPHPSRRGLNTASTQLDRQKYRMGTFSNRLVQASIADEIWAGH